MRSHRSSASFLIAGALTFVSCHCGKPVSRDSGAPPACRLQKPRPALERTAAEALRRIRESYPLPFARIVVNPSQIAPNTLPLYVVTDAPADAVDANGCPRAGASQSAALDPLSVKGICVAQDQRILCSAGAIDAAFGKSSDSARIVSPFLFYLFVHELAHIALHHPGAMSANGFELDLSASRAEKLSKLSTSCLVDADQVAREEAADQIAFAAMPEAFRSPPFSIGFADATSAYVKNSENAYEGAERVLAQAPQSGPDEDNLRPTDDICDVLEANTGQLHVPTLGGDHPHIWRRLGVLMYTLSADLTKAATTSELPAELRESIDEIRSDSFDANIENFAMEAAVRRICRTVGQAQANTLDCSAAAVDERRWVHDDDLESVGFKEGQETRAPVTIPAPRNHHEPAAPVVAVMSYTTLSPAASEEAARATGLQLAHKLTAFLGVLDQRLEETGGYIVWLDAEPVTSKQDILSGGFEVDAKLSLVLRASPGFDPSALVEWKALPDHGRPENELTVVPWAQLAGRTIMQFYRTADHQEDAPAERIVTRDMRIDELFDLDAARSGRPNAIAPAFHALLCYARARLDALHHEPYELRATAPGNGAFYFNASVQPLPPAWESNFPASWAPLANTQCPDVSHGDAQHVATLGTLFRGTQELPPAEFARIFASDIAPAPAQR